MILIQFLYRCPRPQGNSCRLECWCVITPLLTRGQVRLLPRRVTSDGGFTALRGVCGTGEEAKEVFIVLGNEGGRRGFWGRVGQRGESCWLREGGIGADRGSVE